MAAKQKFDETNTLFVIGLPDGQIKRAISKWHVDNMLSKLEIETRVRMDIGRPIEPDAFLKLVTAAQEQINSMTDPTIR